MLLSLFLCFQGRADFIDEMKEGEYVIEGSWYIGRLGKENQPPSLYEGKIISLSKKDRKIILNFPYVRHWSKAWSEVITPESYDISYREWTTFPIGTLGFPIKYTVTEKNLATLEESSLMNRLNFTWGKKGNARSASRSIRQAPYRDQGIYLIRSAKTYHSSSTVIETEYLVSPK